MADEELPDIDIDMSDAKVSLNLGLTFTKKKSKTHISWLWVFLALTIIGMIVIWQSNFVFFGDNNTTQYIALVGPMSGPSKSNGLAMQQGVQLYLDQINKQETTNKLIKLKIFDDQDKSELAAEIALDIATNHSDVLAVIGHYNSNASLAAAPIYKKHGIPVITGTATADAITKDNDWYFRIIFNNSDQGALVANYIQKTLNFNHASVLFDEDSYGSTLAAAFSKTAKETGLTIKHKWGFNANDTIAMKNTFKAIEKAFLNSPEDFGILFLATHSTEAVQAITSLQSLKGRISFIGADALSSSNFANKLQAFPQERTQPGYFTNGIYTISPFLLDIASEHAHKFRHAFIKEYKVEPTATSSMYYDAALVIVDAMHKTFAQKNTNLPIRTQIRDNLWQLSRLEDAIEGVTGEIYFDENGDAIKSIPIGIFKKGRPIVAMRQYQPLAQLRGIDNLLQEVLNNRIIQLNGKFMSQAQVVYVGIDFNDVSELDAQESTFTSDIFLWFRFKGEFDDNNIEFINIYDPKDNDLGTPILKRKSTIEKDVTTVTYRLKIPFKIDFDFQDFPLDVQVLPIFFRHKALTRDKLIYVVDVQGMDIDKLKDYSNTSDTKIFSVGGWHIKDVAFFQNVQKNDSTLGLPELFGERQRIEYSRFNVTITINRYLLNFILKNLLPTIFLIILGYFAFFIPATSFGTRLSLGTNMIVATSLFHIKLAAELPKIDYLILIEYFFFLVYFLAIFVIGAATTAHLRLEREDDDCQLFVERLDLFGKIVYPSLLLVFVGVIAYFYKGMI